MLQKLWTYKVVRKFVMNVTKGITQIAVDRMFLINILKMLHYIYIYIYRTIYITKTHYIPLDDRLYHSLYCNILLVTLCYIAVTLCYIAVSVSQLD